jgi:hypothetical protein
VRNGHLLLHSNRRNNAIMEPGRETVQKLYRAVL